MSQKRLIDTLEEVMAYLAKLKYALMDSHCQIVFQESRKVDENRNPRFTNIFTISDLAPNQKPTDFIRKELAKLTVEDYQCSVLDTRYPKRKPMYVFAKEYKADNVYIKIRVELLEKVNSNVFVMSFHYSDQVIGKDSFPYK
ncbi:MAG: hypothetical protein JEZ05_09850 [Tenericutes bacterium]|nr:hypothetical protein [Mycoplasmatota bacterium]